MSPRKLILAGSAIIALIAPLRAPADEISPIEAPAPATNKPAFKAKLQGGEMVGAHQIQRAFLNIGTNQIAFIVPTDFWMDTSKPGKIVLTQKDMRCFITIAVQEGVGALPEISSLKAAALSRYPGAQIINDSAELAANHSGHAFELEWTNAGGVVQSARISFIPMAAGILEFSVLARDSEFKDARNYYDVILSSVQTNESGKLVIVPLPDFS